MAESSVIITPTQADLDRIRGYREGKWHEWTNYECLDCQWSSIFRERIEKHVAEGDHPWAYPGQYPRELEPDTGEPTY